MSSPTEKAKEPVLPFGWHRLMSLSADPVLRGRMGGPNPTDDLEDMLEVMGWVDEQGAPKVRAVRRGEMGLEVRWNRRTKTELRKVASNFMPARICGNFFLATRLELAARASVYDPNTGRNTFKEQAVLEAIDAYGGATMAGATRYRMRVLTAFWTSAAGQKLGSDLHSRDQERLDLILRSVGWAERQVRDLQLQLSLPPTPKAARPRM